MHKRLQGVMTFNTGLSDFHYMVMFATKLHVPNKNYVPFLHLRFNADKYEKDLSCVLFHVGEVFDNIDDSYWYYETLLKEIANEHAPLKVKTIRHEQVALYEWRVAQSH